MFDEKFAYNKHPKKGKCKKSPFMNGYHRVGFFPMESLLDGGCPGDRVKLFCIECGKAFKESAFVPISQPNKLGVRYETV